MNFPVIIVLIHSYYIFHLRLDKGPATNYSNVMYKIFRVKMLPTVKYDGAPKHDKMCSKPHSQSMGPYQKEITGKTFKSTLFTQFVNM